MHRQTSHTIKLFVTGAKYYKQAPDRLSAKGRGRGSAPDGAATSMTAKKSYRSCGKEPSGIVPPIVTPSARKWGSVAVGQPKDVEKPQRQRENL